MSKTHTKTVQQDKSKIQSEFHEGSPWTWYQQSIVGGFVEVTKNISSGRRMWRWTGMYVKWKYLVNTFTLWRIKYNQVHYPRRLYRSAWVDFRARLSVCLFVRSITQKRMIPKCSNLVYKCYCSGFKGQGHRVNKCIFHTNVRRITQKRMIPVFRLDIGNDLGISCKWYGFRLKGQRSRLRWLRLGLGLTIMSAA